MTDLFSRASEIGLAHVTEWMPGGKRDSDEYTALNPTRPDKHMGSFRVNTRTGAWADFSTDDRGGDAVSLYAYLNWARMDTAARERGYRNHDGGIQAEAARAILEQYDSSYFPGDDDDFLPPAPKVTTDSNWEGYTLMERGEKAPPPLDTTWYQKQWGPEVERWDLYGPHGAIVMRIVRFRDGDDKKADRPFTLWSKGGKVRWRCKSLQKPIPLWGAPELTERQNAPVLVCEGQKAASRAAAMLVDYVCVGWYGGVNRITHADWSPLVGRHVWFWPDADNAGRSRIAALKQVADEIGFELHVVCPPPGVAQGWDVADAIEEGRSADDIKALIEKGSAPSRDIQVQYIDDVKKRFPLATESLDDIQDAWRLADWLGGDFVWSELMGSWMVYECGVWQKDNEEMKVLRRTKEAIIAWEQDARVRGDLNGVAHHKAILKNINRIIRLLQSMKSDTNVMVCMFDHADHLLNCRNGTYNLDTGELQPHARDDYHTKQVNADFDPSMTVPEEFTRFISEIFLGDEELIRYVQKILGYSLSGGTGEQEFYIFHGEGNNGKSQLIKCFSYIADSYAHNMSADKIMQNKYQNNDTYIAQLKKIRALFCSESAQSRTLDSDLIKTLTGGEPITVAQKYEKPITFEISAKMFLITNNKPAVRDTTEGIWRRIRLIPFDYTVPKASRVKDYGKVLYKSGPSGILNWLIEGYQLYRIEGLDPPDVVLAKDAEYRSEEDIMLQFLTDNCQRVKGNRILLEEVFQAFNRFVGDTSIRWSKKRLSKELKAKHLVIEHGQKGAMVNGIAWKEARPGELPLETADAEDALKKGGLIE